LAAPANNSSNLKSRIVTAVVVGAIALASMFLLPQQVWQMLILLVVFLAASEWSRLSGFAGAAHVAASLSTPLLCLALLQTHPVDLWLPLALFWLLVAPLWLRLGWSMPRGPAGLLLGWLILVPTGLAAIGLQVINPSLLLAAILVAVVADTAAYFAGRRFGRHKLAPAISPGKTWEGAAGALLGVSLYALAIGLLAGATLTGLLKLLLAGWLLLLVSIVGDLFESHAKRQAGVKDSGTLLPGHGGILDRIDSLTAVLPTAMLLWLWLH
jgi:phosphatidate cytidylyltransferase